jgi:hypothetical protein
MERWNNKLGTFTDLKESNHVEVAEYTVSKNLFDAPYLVWWFPYVIKKRSHIIADVTKRYHKGTRKFGIQAGCLILDKENGSTLWQDAVRKDVKNVQISFQILNGDEAVPPTYQDIRFHMIVDFKMEDFYRKSRFVAGGHTSDTPHAMTYVSVVSRDLVRITLTLAALNYLDVNMDGIENA